jgi:hypothetical protein
VVRPERSIVQVASPDIGNRLLVLGDWDSVGSKRRSQPPKAASYPGLPQESHVQGLVLAISPSRGHTGAAYPAGPSADRVGSGSARRPFTTEEESGSSHGPSAATWLPFSAAGAISRARPRCAINSCACFAASRLALDLSLVSQIDPGGLAVRVGGQAAAAGA